jgi:hypothetical protein
MKTKFLQQASPGVTGNVYKSAAMQQHFKGAPQAQMSQAQQDAIMLNNIWARGIERLQPIISQAYNPANQTQVTLQPQNVGLVRGFLIKITGTITNTNSGASGVALTRTQFGASNVLTNIVFTDTNNQVRHQTQGWHLGLINSAKQPMVMGGAYSPNVPVNYGNNWTVQSAQSSVTTGSPDAAVSFYYYIPLSYGKYDLRGAMWAGITNAVAQLQLTINPTPVVASGDASLAVYSGNTGGWKSGTTVQIDLWQDYIDQIPMVNTSQGPQPLVPTSLLQTLYCLNNTTLTGLTPAQDFGVPFGNWRQFLSTVIVYNNAGVLNVGSDINNFKLQTANTSQIWKTDPNTQALLARSTFMADPPAGVYYFDSRLRPINTQQWGNVQIYVNPITVTNSTSALWVGWEYFTQANQVTNAQALPTGG